MVRATRDGGWAGGRRERDHRRGLDWTSSRVYTAPANRPRVELLLLFLVLAP